MQKSGSELHSVLPRYQATLAAKASKDDVSVCGGLSRASICWESAVHAVGERIENLR